MHYKEHTASTITAHLTCSPVHVKHSAAKNIPNRSIIFSSAIVVSFGCARYGTVRTLYVPRTTQRLAYACAIGGASFYVTTKPLTTHDTLYCEPSQEARERVRTVWETRLVAEINGKVRYNSQT